MKKSIIILFLFVSLGSVAQTIDTLTQVVNNVFNPTIADAYKLNEYPSIIETTPPQPVINYTISSKRIGPRFDVDPIKPAQLVGEPLIKLYRTLVKAGFGNNTTPYAEIWMNNLRSREYSYGLHFKHLSSSGKIDGKGYTGFMDDVLNLYGKKFLAKQTLSGDLNYSNNIVHFYGFDANKIEIKDDNKLAQQYGYFSAKANLTTHLKDSSKINYNATLGFNNLNDIYGTTESNILAKADLSGYLEKNLITGTVGVDYYNRKTVQDTMNNTIISAQPVFVTKGDQWQLDLGANLTADFMNSTSQFHIYPAVSAHYNVVEEVIIPYVHIGGGLQKNSHKSVSDANPFISNFISLANTSKNFEFLFGIRGALSTMLSYNVSGSYGTIDNQLFFVLDTNFLYRNKFNAVYDNVKLLHMHGELAWQKTEKIHVMLTGDYYSYTLDQQKFAWHTPDYKVSLLTNYCMRDKIVLKLNMFIAGKQYARSSDAKGYKELAGYADVNLGVEYRYTKRLGMFVNLNNIFAQNYYRWDNYPVLGFNVLAGLSYSF